MKLVKIVLLIVVFLNCVLNNNMSFDNIKFKDAVSKIKHNKNVNIESLQIILNFNIKYLLSIDFRKKKLIKTKKSGNILNFISLNHDLEPSLKKKKGTKDMSDNKNNNNARIKKVSKKKK